MLLFSFPFVQLLEPLSPLDVLGGGRGTALVCFPSYDRRSSWIGGDLPFPWLHVLICQPVFRSLLKGMKRKRRFWVAVRNAGVWEGEFKSSLQIMEERGYDDWVDHQYKIHFRMDKHSFLRLHGKYDHALEKNDTRLRKSIPSDKRLAITLHWLSHGLSFEQLGLMYAIGKSTAVGIVHSTIAVLRRILVPDCIRFPEGRELDHVLTDFENLAGLPQCAGAIDGTFMRTDKPLHFGDS